MVNFRKIFKKNFRNHKGDEAYGMLRHELRFYSGRIRILVAMATSIFHRFIMGKVEIDIFFCLNRDM